MKSVLTEQDVEINDVIDDYQNYCFEENLIPDEWKWMRAIVAGATFDANVRLGIYYDQTNRGFSKHSYIGLYKEKSVRAIGKVNTIIVMNKVNNEITYTLEKGEKVTGQHKSIIMEAIEDAKQYGYNLVDERFFFVDKFYLTDFKKATPNPIQKAKFFDLTELLNVKQLPSTEEIAIFLLNKNWGK